MHRLSDWHLNSCGVQAEHDRSSSPLSQSALPSHTHPSGMQELSAHRYSPVRHWPSAPADATTTTTTTTTSTSTTTTNQKEIKLTGRRQIETDGRIAGLRELVAIKDSG